VGSYESKAIAKPWLKNLGESWELSSGGADTAEKPSGVDPDLKSLLVEKAFKQVLPFV